MKPYAAALLSLFGLFLSSPTFAQKAPKPPINNRFDLIPNGKDDTLRFQFGSCALWMPSMAKKHFDIYETMIKDPADFMIWMGDHIYMLNSNQWGSYRGIVNRYHEVRTKVPFLQNFLDSRPQYAIWDDHEFGPNNADGDWKLKDTSLVVFKEMWANPSYGLPNVPGVFFNVRHADAEIFFTDGRFHCHKWDVMFGAAQMAWLKEKMSASTARFKFVVCGSQILNTSVGSENLSRYGTEYKELTDFLAERKISGVVFLSGDRHFSEVSKLERPGLYPLYDLTCSSLTSIFFPDHLKNANRVAGSFTKRHCYGRITLLGSGPDRRCSVDWIDRKGKIIKHWEAKATDLGNP